MDRRRSATAAGFCFDPAHKGAEALRAASQAADDYDQTAGPNHWRTAAALYLQGQLLAAMGRNDEALPALKRAADIHERILGAHPTTGANLNKLGEAYLAKRDPAAIAVLNRALQINKGVLGPEEPETLVSMNDLGVAYFYQNNYAGAS